MNARRLAELEAALQDPSVAAVADVHSDERRLLADALRGYRPEPVEYHEPTVENWDWTEPTVAISVAGPTNAAAIVERTDPQ